MRALALMAVLFGAVEFAQAADIKVTMAGSAYSPATIKAKVGDTLIFENDDMTGHWVFAPTRGFAFDLGAQKQGETRRFALRQSGKLEIECVNHADMKIIVEVQP